MDAATINALHTVFASLHVPVRLLMRSGKSLIPDEIETFYIPDALPDEGYIQRAGYLFQLTQDRQHVLAVRDEKGAQDVLKLAGALLETLVLQHTDRNSVDNAYKRLLVEPVTQADAEAIAAEHHILLEQPRVVMLLHIVRAGLGSSADALRELIPLAEGDQLVLIDPFAAALIKDMTTIDMDELKEFASALYETLFSESAFRVTIGVSEPVGELTELHPAYMSAQRAVEVGRLFRENESVHYYGQLMLERFLMSIAPATAARYHRLLFNQDTASLFTDEMLDTINMFLAKDLNLSDTARQLYIHRNTLVYRLDKVQRQIGLDLRRFEDALTFKMLYHMKKCMRNQAHETTEEKA